MKYDVLEPFREYLLDTEKNRNTAMTYYRAVEKLFRSRQFNSLSQIETQWLLQETARSFRTKSEYSAVKNGLKRLARFDRQLQLPAEEEFLEVSRKKRNYSKRSRKTICLEQVQRRINQIKDEKLKYAYRLSMISGLRVHELAQLEASDICLDGERILVTVRGGKGGHGGVITCREDKYLSERLPEFLRKNQTGKLFYSTQHMKNYAVRLGIECHDLRRIFAICLRDELKKEMPVREANALVQEQLRHDRFSTTKRYLFNRKLKLRYTEADEAQAVKKYTGGSSKESEKNCQDTAEL